MTEILWIHHDALSREHPVFRAAPDARAVFVWDATDLERRGWTLKRCVFVMECAEAMDVELLTGCAADVLAELSPTRLWLAETPDPAFQETARNVADRTGCEVKAVAAPPFIDLPPGTDMGRYFRFWNKARRSALSRTDELLQTRETDG